MMIEQAFMGYKIDARAGHLVVRVCSYCPDRASLEGLGNRPRRAHDARHLPAVRGAPPQPDPRRNSVGNFGLDSLEVWREVRVNVQLR